jgi:hypothetical protein
MKMLNSDSYTCNQLFIDAVFGTKTTIDFEKLAGSKLVAAKRNTLTEPCMLLTNINHESLI